jgi:hypothetical protein
MKFLRVAKNTWIWLDECINEAHCQQKNNKSWQFGYIQKQCPWPCNSFTLSNLMKSTWQHVLFLLTKITDFVSALPSECKREIPLGVVNNGGKTIDEYCLPYVMYSCVVYFTRTHAKKIIILLVPPTTYWLGRLQSYELALALSWWI